MSNAPPTKDLLTKRLTSEQGPDRPFYALGTLLGADDFVEEQLYHRGRLARALAYLFGAGTVAGLKIGFRRGPRTGEADPSQDEIIVEPGLAIDPFGRLIELPRRACIRLKPWIDYWRAKERLAILSGAIHGSNAVAWLFIRFLPCERGKTPVLAQGPFDATNSIASSRVRDGYELRLFLDKASETPAFPRDATNKPTPRPSLAGAPGSQARIEALEDLILNGWGGPSEHSESPGWVLLGRVDIPVLSTASDVEYDTAGIPADADFAANLLDNHVRPFVYGAWALALEADLPLLPRSSNST